MIQFDEMEHETYDETYGAWASEILGFQPCKIGGAGFAAAHSPYVSNPRDEALKRPETPSILCGFLGLPFWRLLYGGFHSHGGTPKWMIY